jgi:hypothetical protein
MFNIDLYLLATQGQYSPDRTEFWTPDGFYIFIEEEIITTRRGGGYGPGAGELVKKKRITLHVSGGGISFKETIIVENINLRVDNVNYDTLNNTIKVDLSDVEFTDIKKTINITRKD